MSWVNLVFGFAISDFAFGFDFFVDSKQRVALVDDYGELRVLFRLFILRNVQKIRKWKEASYSCRLH